MGLSVQGSRWQGYRHRAADASSPAPASGFPGELPGNPPRSNDRSVSSPWEGAHFDPFAPQGRGYGASSFPQRTMLGVARYRPSSEGGWATLPRGARRLTGSPSMAAPPDGVPIGRREVLRGRSDLCDPGLSQPHRALETWVGPRSGPPLGPLPDDPAFPLEPHG